MITTDDFKKIPDVSEKIKQLTITERKWVNRLEKVLCSCPTGRIALLTIGDNDLTIVDGEYVKKYNLEVCDGCAEENGVVLARVKSRPDIWGVSG